MSVTASNHMKPDQQVVCYTIEVAEAFPQQLPSDESQSLKVFQVTTRCLLTYTFSSLKKAIASQNAGTVKEAIAANAWLYGIEQDRRFYENKQVKKSSWIEGVQVPPKSVRFGTESVWEFHLSVAEKACGGDCATDALATHNQEIIQSVAAAILKKGFPLPSSLLKFSKNC